MPALYHRLSFIKSLDYDNKCAKIHVPRIFQLTCVIKKVRRKKYVLASRLIYAER